ncbi:MAG: thiamine-phosphate kinase [Candidatus Omnitrophota bacterium]
MAVGEFGLIDLIKRRIPRGKGVIRGIGDDAAVLPFNKEKYLLLTTDMLAEGVHFSSAMGAKKIGHKALACNISDIAAMGGWPTWAVVSLAVPVRLRVRYVEDIYSGMGALARMFSVGIVGGDTVRGDKMIINIALLGEVKKKQLVMRRGAQEGDIIFVTGRLGRSLKSGRHLSFLPRLKEAQFLTEHFKPSAMIDISDGLVADLRHILTESGIGAEINLAQIPRSRQATLPEALYDGEDFELLFTLSPRLSKKLRALRRAPFCFYPIGRVVRGAGQIHAVDTNGRRTAVRAKGYAHF